MHTQITRFIVCFFCLYFLAGCGSAAKYQNIPDGTDLQIPIPQRTKMTQESLPAEIKMVCSAVINKLRKREETPHVRFYQAAANGISKENFNYDGFDVRGIDFTSIDLTQTTKDQAEGSVEGVLHFEDFIGRKTSLFFLAEFMVSPYGISIHRSHVIQLPPFFPDVEAFYVPYAAFITAKKNLHSYQEFYTFALANAYVMEPTPKEQKAFDEFQQLSSWKKKKVTQNKEKTIAMVFCKDRLKNVARFEVAASRGNIKPVYLNKDNWPIVLYAANFVPDNWLKPFDIMAFYTPEDNAKRYVVGRFTNQKNYKTK